MPEPNFFIVGAARSGTTALWHYLRQHPDVFLSAVKEPSFFCRSMPPSWAVRDLDTYLALFAEAGDASAIGEASTGYFGSPESPGLIRARYPHARIIIMLRNPVDRAYSLYRLNTSIGVERMPTFERALGQEDDRLASERFKRRNPYFWAAYLYFRSGLTASKLETYQQTFPREQLHVILYDDFKRSTLEATRAVFSFLGVDSAFEPSIKVVHESGFPISPQAHYLLYLAARRRAAARNGQEPTRLDRGIRRAYSWNLRLGSKFRRKGIRPATRRQLLVRYKQDIERTGELLGRDLGHWLAPLSV